MTSKDTILTNRDSLINSKLKFGNNAMLKAKVKGNIIRQYHRGELRIIRRLNLMISQPFLYICIGQYTIAMIEVTTQEYVYNISYIVFSI